MVAVPSVLLGGATVSQADFTKPDEWLVHGFYELPRKSKSIVNRRFQQSVRPRSQNHAVRCCYSFSTNKVCNQVFTNSCEFVQFVDSKP